MIERVAYLELPCTTLRTTPWLRTARRPPAQEKRAFGRPNEAQTIIFIMFGAIEAHLLTVNRSYLDAQKTSGALDWCILHEISRRIFLGSSWDLLGAECRNEEMAISRRPEDLRSSRLDHSMQNFMTEL